MMFRVPEGFDMGLVQDAIEEFLINLDPDLYVINVLGLRIAFKGSNITLPTPWTGQMSFGAGSEPPQFMPRFISYVGRSTFGPRWSLKVFGVDKTMPNDFREPLVAATALYNGRGRLQAAFNNGQFVAIDGNPVVVYDYVNWNYNDHWVGEARK